MEPARREFIAVNREIGGKNVLASPVGNSSDTRETIESGTVANDRLAVICSKAGNPGNPIIAESRHGVLAPETDEIWGRKKGNDCALHEECGTAFG